MEEDDEIVEKVNKANTQFYRAFENLSIEMMDNLWKHEKTAIITGSGRGIGKETVVILAKKAVNVVVTLQDSK